MKTENADVGEFFDRIADGYRDKYTAKDRFLEYFFNERLAESSRGFDLKNKRVLDIGAGTGNLYDHLLRIEPTIDYYATDIAGEMLNQSLIPKERRFVGTLDEIDLPVDRFDYVFMLGVTTYIDNEELGRVFKRIDSLLGTGGRAVITFTNQDSIDWMSRRFVKNYGKRLLPRKYVLGQDFTIYPRSLSEVSGMFGDGFETEDVRWLNHTVFPLNQALKGASVAAAKRIHGSTNVGLMRRLSSDFLVVYKKK